MRGGDYPVRKPRTGNAIMMLGEILFPPADNRRTTLSLLSWWEARRGTFNLIVGATGLLTLVALRLIAWIPPFVYVPFDWRPVAVYGLLANVCYTFGWVIESVAQRVWGDRCSALGPALFRQGVAFSVGLTLLPILLASFAWVGKVAAFFVR